MKKFLSILLAVMLVLSLAACGGKDDPKPSSSSGTGNTPSASTQQGASPSSETEALRDDSDPVKNKLEALGFGALTFPEGSAPLLGRESENSATIILQNSSEDTFQDILKAVFIIVSADGEVTSDEGTVIASAEDGALGGEGKYEYWGQKLYAEIEFDPSDGWLELYLSVNE